MQKQAVIVLLIVASYVVVAAQQQQKREVGERRLIELSPTDRRWVTKEQLLELVAQNVHFFDVTNRQPLPRQQELAAQPTIPPNLQHQAFVKALFTSLSAQSISNTDNSLANFHTRYYESDTAVQAADWLFNQYRTVIEKSKEILQGAQASYFFHDWAQPSLIVTIPGFGNNSDEIVILGGHIDSIVKVAGQPFDPDARSPGADDDASGSSTVFEVFKALALSGFRPSRTVVFHAYSAEEVGLRGSQDIAETYRRQNKKVAGMMQLDMTGYPDPKTGKTLKIIDDFVNANLTVFLDKCVAEYSSLPYFHSVCGYACSDHASWNRTNYNACRVKEAGNYQYIHTTQDTPDRVDFDYSLEFAKVALGWLVELSLWAGQ